jgi:hypothetical protein
VVSTIAALATHDELIVVYDHQGRMSRRLSADALMTALRERLPRHSLVAVLVSGGGRELAADAALLGELLEVGAVIVAITSTSDPRIPAIELARRIDADQVVQLRYDPQRGTVSRRLWTRPAGPGSAPAGSPHGRDRSLAQ